MLLGNLPRGLQPYGSLNCVPLHFPDKPAFLLTDGRNRPLLKELCKALKLKERHGSHRLLLASDDFLGQNVNNMTRNDSKAFKIPPVT